MPQGSRSCDHGRQPRPRTCHSGAAALAAAPARLQVAGGERTAFTRTLGAVRGWGHRCLMLGSKLLLHDVVGKPGPELGLLDEPGPGVARRGARRRVAIAERDGPVRRGRYLPVEPGLLGLVRRQHGDDDAKQQRGPHDRHQKGSSTQPATTVTTAPTIAAEPQERTSPNVYL